MLEHIFFRSSIQKTLVGVLGRVVRRTRGFPSPLAGPGAFRVIPLAYRLLSPVAGVVPRLADQLVAFLVPRLGVVPLARLIVRRLGQARCRWVGEGWLSALMQRPAPLATGRARIFTAPTRQAV